MARKLHRHHKSKKPEKKAKKAKGDKPRKWIKTPEGKWVRAERYEALKAGKKGKKDKAHKRDKAEKPEKKAKKRHAIKSKLTQAQLLREIADRVEQKPKDIKAVLGAFTEIAIEQINAIGEFRIAGLVKMKIKDVPERPKGKYMVFGKKKKLPRRPAFKRLKALPLKAAKVATDALPPPRPKKD